MPTDSLLDKARYGQRLAWPLWRVAAAVLLILGAVGEASSQAADADSLVQVVLDARDQLRPVTDDEVAVARRELGAAAVRLEAALVPGSQLGEAWKDYLAWQGVQRQLAPDVELDLRALQTTLDLLTSGQPGLEREEFRAAAVATTRLLNLGLLSRTRQPTRQFRQQAERLAKELARDPRAEDPRVSWQMQRRFARFETLGQTPRVVAAMRRELRQPNLNIVAGERVLDLLARRPVAEQRPLTDTILGTSITGTGVTRGAISLQLSPSPTSARLAFGLGGTIASDTRGVNGPVVICSAGETCFQGLKTVELTDHSFRVLPASMDASTQTRTRSITKRGGRLGKRLVEAIAERKVAESRGQANAIASRKAERLVSSEFDEQVLEEVRKARGEYDRLVRWPLRRRGMPAERVHFATTSDELYASAVLAGAQQLAAASSPPPAPGGDLSLRLHQSALNNLAEAFLGGATIQQQSADGGVEIDAVLPPRVREALADPTKVKASADEGQAFRPWAIELRRDRPLSFVVNENSVAVLVHASRIASGEEVFRNWDVILKYRPKRSPSGWVVQLVGEVDVLPTSFDPGQPGARIPSKQRALRRNLAKQLTARTKEGGSFPRRVELKPIDLARLNKPGLSQLIIGSLAADDGWLSVAFDAR